MQTIVKTGISLRKSLFDQAEDLAHKMNVSRSRLLSLALEDYLQRQQNVELLAQINAACSGGLDDEEREFLKAAGEQFSRQAKGEW